MTFAPATLVALSGFPFGVSRVPPSRCAPSGVGRRCPYPLIGPGFQTTTCVPEAPGGYDDKWRSTAPLPHGLHRPRSEAEEITRRRFVDQGVPVGKVGFNRIAALINGVRGRGRAVFGGHCIQSFICKPRRTECTVLRYRWHEIAGMKLCGAFYFMPSVISPCPTAARFFRLGASDVRLGWRSQ